MLQRLLTWNLKAEETVLLTGYFPLLGEFYFPPKEGSCQMFAVGDEAEFVASFL